MQEGNKLMIEAERRRMDLPEKLAIAALVGATITLIVFGGVLSAVLLLVTALVGWTRAFEENAAKGKPTLSGRGRLFVGGASAALAAIFHPNLSASVSHVAEPAPAATPAQRPAEARQTAKVPAADLAERRRKLASLIAGERKLDRQDVEGRLVFWDQIVALAPDDPKLAAQRADVERQVEELAIFRDQPELGAEIAEISNRLEGFGIVSVMNVTIRNRALSNLKDFRISCEHMSASGTVISRTNRTIYEVVPARSTKSFRNVNMGVVNPQSKRFSCQIDGASVG